VVTGCKRRNIASGTVNEDQRAKMMGILHENRKKEYPKSVTELLKARGKNICARRLLLHKQNS
jgi:hypothetical protein